MGVFTREERDALITVLARRWRLWDMHQAKETLSGATYTHGSAYADHYLLYHELGVGFDEADNALGTREELRERIDALARRLETEYAVALQDVRAREEFTAMVAEMLRAAAAPGLG